MKDKMKEVKGMTNKEILQDIHDKLCYIEDNLRYRNKKISKLIELIYKINLRS
jgi:hypothetical protein